MAEQCLESPIGLADVVEIDGVQLFKNLNRHRIIRRCLGRIGGQTS